MTKAAELQKLLEDLLVEKTFSLEIVEMIKKMRDQVASLLSENEMLLKSNETLSKGYNDTKLLLDKALETNSKYEERENELIGRERVADKRDYELSFQKSRADEIKELFIQLIKPVRIRRSVSGSRPFEAGNNYPTTLQYSETNEEEEL